MYLKGTEISNTHTHTHTYIYIKNDEIHAALQGVIFKQ